jgi:hypothetical protein
MSKIIQFGNPKRKNASPCASIIKIIDGEAVEFVNVDILTPELRRRLFVESEKAERIKAFAPRSVD